MHVSYSALLVVVLVTACWTSGAGAGKNRAGGDTEGKLGRRSKYRFLLLEAKYRKAVKGLSQKFGNLEALVDKGVKERQALNVLVQELRSNLSRSSRILQDTLSRVQKSAQPLPQSDQQGSQKVPKHAPLTTTASPPKIIKLGTPKDCQEVYLNGGFVYDSMMITKIRPATGRRSFDVPCVQEGGAGWTVVQQAGGGQTDFDRSWKEYKHGFGGFEGEFWLGNERLHKVTSQADYKLRVEITNKSGDLLYAEYSKFQVAGEDKRYAIKISGYDKTSTLPDGLTRPWSTVDRMPFTTKDRDNDETMQRNCAQVVGGAWWYRACDGTTVNGHVPGPGSHHTEVNSLFWDGVPKHQISSTRMLMTPVTGEVPFPSFSLTNRYPA